jgi:hypothetical protein
VPRRRCRGRTDSIPRSLEASRVRGREDMQSPCAVDPNCSCYRPQSR